MRYTLGICYNEWCWNKQFSSVKSGCYNECVGILSSVVAHDGKRRLLLNCPYNLSCFHFKHKSLFILWHTQRGTALINRLPGFQPVKKVPAFYGTPRFITAFTNARQLSLSWDNSINCISIHPTSWRSTLILSSHLCTDLASGRFPSSFPTKTKYTPFLFPIRATCPANHIILDFITRTIFGKQYRSLSSLLWSFLHSLVPSSLLAPNILLNTLFSKPSAYFPPAMWTTKFHTHKNKRRITVCTY
jgi:hypothetical protein